MFKIGILQLTSHLDAAVDGFKAGLAGVEADYIYYNVEGKVPEMAGCAAKLAEAKVDLIFACTTPAAKHAKALAADIPVLFTPVFDPVTTGLVATPEQPEGKVTGVCGQVKAADKIAMLKQLLPNAKKVTLLQDKADGNAAIETANFLQAAADYDVTVVAVEEADLTNLTKLAPAEADAIFLPIGPVVEKNFTAIKAYADSKQLPIIASHGPNVAEGAVAALIANHKDLGVACGQLAKQILIDKKAIAQLPVEYPKAPELLLNKAAAAKIGLNIPASLLQTAVKVIE